MSGKEHGNRGAASRFTRRRVSSKSRHFFRKSSCRQLWVAEGIVRVGISIQPAMVLSPRGRPGLLPAQEFQENYYNQHCKGGLKYEYESPVT